MKHKNHTVIIYCFCLILLIPVVQTRAQTASVLPVQYEELTALKFEAALEQAGQTCIIPLGILEKHGPHLPLGTDLLSVRALAITAAGKEYAIVFPPYYVGQIYEAKHQPGTVAYSPDLVWNYLQETCDELSRNGVKKIILVNGHGGNNSFLAYFCQVQLASRKNYAVYLFKPVEDPEISKKIESLRKTKVDGHAGEMETSGMLKTHPDLVHMDVAGSQSGDDQNRITDLPDAYVGIWWYARFPNHYAGDGRAADKKLGELLFNNEVEQLVKMIRAVKQDTMVLKLQDQFFDQTDNPLKTPQ
jgi:creatinine amidohydrolase